MDIVNDLALSQAATIVCDGEGSGALTDVPTGEIGFADTCDYCGSDLDVAFCLYENRLLCKACNCWEQLEVIEWMV